jgi:hypothetical protein
VKRADRATETLRMFGMGMLLTALFLALGLLLTACGETAAEVKTPEPIVLETLHERMVATPHPCFKIRRMDAVTRVVADDCVVWENRVWDGGTW